MNRKEANLLLITFDQWRGDWTDPVNPIVRLPCLQELGKNGLIARYCYTSSPQCVPARISWLTGLKPSQLGVTRNCNANVPNDAPSTFRELQKQGWYTEIIGKTHWTSHMRPGDLRENISLLKDLGFDHAEEIAGPRALQIMQCDLTDDWKREGVFNQYLENMKKRYKKGRTEQAWTVNPSILPKHLYPDIWIANRGVEAIKRMPSTKPWLLWISFVGPHEPFDTPEMWSEKTMKEIPASISRGSWINNLSSEVELYKTAKGWDNLLKTEKINALRRDYANNLKLLDDQILLLTNAIKQRTDFKHTGIAITADHGEMLGDHDMLYKGTFLESSIRVPFMYIPPETKKIDQIIINKPSALTRSLTAVVNNLKTGGGMKALKRSCMKQKYVTVEYGDEIVVIRNKKKLCCSKNGIPQWAIDLKKDPDEQKNLLAKKRNTLFENRAWMRLLERSKRETIARTQENWIWRNILE